MLVTLLLPKGIVGTLADGWSRLRARRRVNAIDQSDTKAASQPQAAE